MQETIMDERGRITLGKRIAKRYGRKFAVVPAQTEIILVPKPKNPLKSLQEWGREAGLNKLSLRAIKRMAEEEAERETRIGS